jgi:hypothetical protein
MPIAGQPPACASDFSAARKLRLALKGAVLFLGRPVAVAAGWIRAWVIPLLVLTAMGCALVLRPYCLP